MPYKLTAEYFKTRKASIRKRIKRYQDFEYVDNEPGRRLNRCTSEYTDNKILRLFERNSIKSLRAVMMKLTQKGIEGSIITISSIKCKKHESEQQSATGKNQKNDWLEYKRISTAIRLIFTYKSTFVVNNCLHG